MIPFFRKIRKKMADDNRPIKYLRYAIGEIVLVVIGILIALQINNYNARKKSVERIDAFFEIVLEDLEAEIEESNARLGYQGIRDSLCYLFMNEQLTEEDYRTGGYRYMLAELTLFYKYFKFQKTGYDQIISNQNDLPEKYDEVMRDLASLYFKTGKSLDYWNKETARIGTRNEDYFTDNCAWYAKNENSDEMISYFLNDPHYKNSVRRVWGGINSQSGFIADYRIEAMNAYQKIARILNKNPFHESFGLSPEAIHQLEGKWIFTEDKDFFVTFKLANHRLQHTVSAMNDSAEVFETYLIDEYQSGSKRVLKCYDQLNSFHLMIIDGDTLRDLSNLFNQKFYREK
jgi:hypothetical protein